MPSAKSSVVNEVNHNQVLAANHPPINVINMQPLVTSSHCVYNLKKIKHKMKNVCFSGPGYSH